MKYRNVIIALGFIIMIMQSLGFPQSVRDVVYIVIGALIISLAYLSSRANRAQKMQTPPAETNNTNNISAHM